MLAFGKSAKFRFGSDDSFRHRSEKQAADGILTPCHGPQGD
jgi:hypothetical protein